ncbi:MAG TPA: hypothetical protein VIQ29_10975, partial [Ancylobacter sp.]
GKGRRRDRRGGMDPRLPRGLPGDEAARGLLGIPGGEDIAEPIMRRTDTGSATQPPAARSFARLPRFGQRFGLTPIKTSGLNENKIGTYEPRAHMLRKPDQPRWIAPARLGGPTMKAGAPGGNSPPAELCAHAALHEFYPAAPGDAAAAIGFAAAAAALAARDRFILWVCEDIARDDPVRLHPSGLALLWQVI